MTIRLSIIDSENYTVCFKCVPCIDAETLTSFVFENFEYFGTHKRDAIEYIKLIPSRKEMGEFSIEIARNVRCRNKLVVCPVREGHCDEESRGGKSNGFR